MLLPEVQLGLNLIIEGCLQRIIERKKKNRRKKERKKKKSFFIRGGVISYVVVTSFFLSSFDAHPTRVSLQRWQLTCLEISVQYLSVKFPT